MSIMMERFWFIVSLFVILFTATVAESFIVPVQTNKLASSSLSPASTSNKSRRGTQHYWHTTTTATTTTTSAAAQPDNMASSSSDNVPHPFCQLPGDPSLILTTNVDLGDKKMEIMKGTYVAPFVLIFLSVLLCCIDRRGLLCDSFFFFLNLTHHILLLQQQQHHYSSTKTIIKTSSRAQLVPRPLVKPRGSLNRTLLFALRTRPIWFLVELPHRPLWGVCIVLVPLHKPPMGKFKRLWPTCWNHMVWRMKHGSISISLMCPVPMLVGVVVPLRDKEKGQGWIKHRTCTMFYNTQHNQSFNQISNQSVHSIVERVVKRNQTKECSRYLTIL